MDDHNTQKIMNSNEICLTVAIFDLIISEGLSFNLTQKPMFKKVLDLERVCQKVMNLQTEIWYPRIFWMQLWSENGEGLECDQD